jgi:hypothetical protein
MKIGKISIKIYFNNPKTASKSIGQKKWMLKKFHRETTSVVAIQDLNNLMGTIPYVAMVKLS